MATANVAIQPLIGSAMRFPNNPLIVNPAKGVAKMARAGAIKDEYSTNVICLLPL
jgi:hypothetical protein